jgi:excisionase family DNA binding protein
VAYTIPETAYVLGCSVPQVRNMLELGALPRTRIGRAVRISRAAVEEFVNTGGVELVRGQQGVALVRARSLSNAARD